jgi:hypothetical protein
MSCFGWGERVVVGIKKKTNQLTAFVFNKTIFKTVVTRMAE